ncbi:MAG: nickel-responsive transcriptional regulator NikR [Polyangiaceae bacterium]
MKVEGKAAEKAHKTAKSEKSELVRFGVAMEAGLLDQFDALVEARGSTRSEALRDLVRAEIVKSHVERGVDAVASLTLVYNHASAEVSERLIEMQHELGERIRSTMHVHLSGGYCLEVIVLAGPSEVLKAAADRLLAVRGVKHGGIEIVTDITKHKHLHAHGAKHKAPPGK